MFLLRTFGALELTTENGDPVAGAAAQRKPLLILALAALVPGGIPRERLLRALWPGVERDRARGTLKQHLYALRRATGNANIVSGSPRLRVATDTIRVDALEFAEHVEHGRLQEAAALLRGELFEDLRAPAGEMLVDLVREIRAGYEHQITTVRKATEARREAAKPAQTPVDLAMIGAERELAAAARRFARGLITLPDDPLAARLRAIATSHDLLEAISVAERAGVSTPRIRELLADAEGFWHRSDLVRQMIVAPPGHADSVATLEWLFEGGVRSADATGRAIEAAVLDSGFAALLRARGDWELRHLVRLLGREAEHPVRVLLLAPRSGRDLDLLLPLLQRNGAMIAISDPDAAVVALAQLRLASLGHRLLSRAGDPFTHLDDLAPAGPFDLILTGGLLDQLTARPATWLTERLVQMLTPGGVLCVSALALNSTCGPWLRHVVRWDVAERDQDDIVMLTGSAAGQCEIAWGRDPAEQGWLVSLRRDGADERHRNVSFPRPTTVGE